MNEHNFTRVESDAAITHWAARSVFRVAEDVPTAMGELCAYLVVSSRFQGHEKHGVVFRRSDGAIVQARRFGGALRIVGDDVGSILRPVNDDLVYQRSFRWVRCLCDDGDVATKNRTGGKLLVERCDRRLPASVHDESGDRLIDPMNRLQSGVPEGLAQ